MGEAARHPNERHRLDALNACRLLDTPPEVRFDDFVHLAAHVCDAPTAAFSLVDTDRQWFKARFGLDAPETPRALSFCAHAILGDALFEVEDATADERFSDNPLVTGPPDVRFYAGVPVAGPGGYPLGTLCVIAPTPGRLDETQRDLLVRLARRLEDVVRARVAEYDPPNAFVSMCAACKAVRQDEQWVSVERYVVDLARTDVSHGICPTCAAQLYADLD